MKYRISSLLAGHSMYGGLPQSSSCLNSADCVELEVTGPQEEC